MNRFDAEIEQYTCEIESSTHHYCNKWLTLEFSADEFEIGNSTCVEESHNGNYCQAWHIEQEEYRKCWKEYTSVDRLSTSDIRGFTITCCHADNRNTEACCRNFCDAPYYNAYEPDRELTDCYCEKESANGKYCEQWHCEEYLHIEDDYHSGRELETYTCHQSDDGQNYCTQWTGDIESINEFEISRCNCSLPSSNGEYCLKWNCDEKGADFWWPNTLWSLFSAILTFVCPLFVVRQMRFDWNNSNTKKDRLWLHFGRYLLVFFTLGTMFILIGVWKAGLVVLFATLIGSVVPYIVLFAMCYDNCCRYERNENEFNCLYSLPQKVVFTTAVYLNNNTDAVTSDDPAIVSSVIPEDDMVIEMTAISHQHQSESQRGVDRAMGEVVVPEGGFDLEFPEPFYNESDSSSSSSDPVNNVCDQNSFSFYRSMVPVAIDHSFLYTQFQKLSSAYSMSSSNSSSNSSNGDRC